MPSLTSSFFSSGRERRLWTCAFVAVAAIYSTLGFAGTLAARFAGTGVGEWIFAAACLLILIAVVTQGLSRRPTAAEWGVALGIAAVYALVFARMAIPTERSHLVEYGVVAICIHAALVERAARGGEVPVPALLTVAATGSLGALDEFIQIVVPNRTYDPVDMLFNVLAGVMAVGASVALAAARRWVAARKRTS